MFAFILRRLSLALAVTFVISAMSFAMMYMAGDPAITIAGESATDVDIEAVRAFYQFDKPIYQQYLSWVGNALQGNFGHSFYLRIPVSELIADRLPVTMTLGFLAMLFAICLAVPLGVAAAVRPNSIVDRLCLLMSVVGQALPSFWFGLLLVLIFSITLGWLPVSGTDDWTHFIMPTVVLGYYATPAIMRLTRAGMLDVLASDYIRTARAKGLKSRTILFKHALRNAIAPVVSIAAVQLGFMLGGSVVVESIFSIHGLGHLAWVSISRNDFPPVQAIILILSLIYVALTLMSDIINAWLDPSIRLTNEL